MENSSNHSKRYLSMNPPPPEGHNNDVGGVIKFLQRLFILVSVVTLLSFVAWFIDSRESQVVSNQPIGRFIGMSGPGGLQGGVVIETELGSYPLIRTAAISKGTPLLLEQRASDDRFICDVPRNLCIKTAGYEFKHPIEIPIDAKTIQSALPSQDKKR